MAQLAGRAAIITGASAGIGYSIAAAFAQEGASVVLAARRPQALAQAVRRLEANGARALAVPTDVTVEEQVLNLFGRTLEAFGRVDILVNNAGTAAGKPTDELSLAEWRQVIDCNLTGAFLCSREALRHMKTQRAGRILNIGSISAKTPRPHSAAYTTSKFGIEGLTRSLALDGREYGIGVSVLQSGNVATPLWAGREEVIGREGAASPDDIARIALLMVTLPPDMNMYETVVLPLKMPFLGRG